MTKARDNHYVPQWYQRGFLKNPTDQLWYLDLSPDKKELADGRIVTMNSRFSRSTSTCFYQTDLYTTSFGPLINDDIERLLFGAIDGSGAKAVRAFIGTDLRGWQANFQNLFSYMDSQKLRTPKGLDWIKSQYPDLNQVDLMVEMQAVRHLHCTLWTEGVREIVSAKTSDVKFILTDHPVTVYNYACSPESELCVYPNDPSIAFKATQTLYPLDCDHCLILTNLEYAKDPDSQNPFENRTHARFLRQSMVRTDAFIRSRALSRDEVTRINLILKARARRYIASPREEWLYPENTVTDNWSDLGNGLLPPDNELYQFGGELYAKFQDGTVYYQDAFGRTEPENKYLRKEQKKIGRNDECGCGSGKKYKKCCLNKAKDDRPSWDVYSIRERNLILYNGLEDILGLNAGKSWVDVRRDLSDNQVKRIHTLYASLWPTSTDLISLLPKPDQALRAVYTGMLDPRVVTIFAIGSTPYFDEVLIQHPFVNPGNVRPEFSPIKSPGQYKHQTIKNVLLFLYLQPFVEAGVVNFFPDPCVFDLYLQKEMMSMAEQRRDGMAIDEQESARFRRLHEEDFARTLRTLPRDRRLAQIRRAMPELEPDKVEDLVDYMEQQAENDPLALLQDNVYDSGGQLTMASLAPNFEMSLYVGQVTGSLILTDSETRWNELTASTGPFNTAGSSRWKHIETALTTHQYPISADPLESFRRRFEAEFVGFRKAFAESASLIANDPNSHDTDYIETIASDISDALASINERFADDEQLSIQGKVSVRIPNDGFANNNVYRLLLKTGSNKRRSPVPMSMFVGLAE